MTCLLWLDVYRKGDLFLLTQDRDRFKCMGANVNAHGKTRRRRRWLILINLGCLRTVLLVMYQDQTIFFRSLLNRSSCQLGYDSFFVTLHIQSKNPISTTFPILSCAFFIARASLPYILAWGTAVLYTFTHAHVVSKFRYLHDMKYHLKIAVFTILAFALLFVQFWCYKFHTQTMENNIKIFLFSLLVSWPRYDSYAWVTKDF